MVTVVSVPVLYVVLVKNNKFVPFLWILGFKVMVLRVLGDCYCLQYFGIRGVLNIAQYFFFLH